MIRCVEAAVRALVWQGEDQITLSIWAFSPVSTAVTVCLALVGLPGEGVVWLDRCPTVLHDG